MTSKNLLYCALISIAILLSGCATSTGRSTTPLPAEIKSQLVTSQPVIAYFHRDPKAAQSHCGRCARIGQHYSSTPVEDGYYRLLLGRNSEGWFLIQDFYQKNKQPQSSPVWVKDPNHVFDFENDVVIGSGTHYYPDGKIVEKFHNTDAENQEGENFYPSGERAITYKITPEKLSYEFWYKSGKPAVKYVEFWKNRRPIDMKGWDENGNEVKDAEEIRFRLAQEIESRLHP